MGTVKRGKQPNQDKTNQKGCSNMNRVKIESLRDLLDSQASYGLEVTDLRLLERAVKEQVGITFITRYEDYETNESFFRMFLLNKGKGICLCQCDLDDWLRGWSRDTVTATVEAFRLALGFPNEMESLCESNNFDLVNYCLDNWTEPVSYQDRDFETGRTLFKTLLESEAE